MRGFLCSQCCSTSVSSDDKRATKSGNKEPRPPSPFFRIRRQSAHLSFTVFRLIVTSTMPTEQFLPFSSPKTNACVCLRRSISLLPAPRSSWPPTTESRSKYTNHPPFAPPGSSGAPSLSSSFPDGRDDAVTRQTRHGYSSLPLSPPLQTPSRQLHSPAPRNTLSDKTDPPPSFPSWNVLRRRVGGGHFFDNCRLSSRAQQLLQCRHISSAIHSCGAALGDDTPAGGRSPFFILLPPLIHSLTQSLTAPHHPPSLPFSFPSRLLPSTQSIINPSRRVERRGGRRDLFRRSGMLLPRRRRRRHRHEACAEEPPSASSDFFAPPPSAVDEEGAAAQDRRGTRAFTNCDATSAGRHERGAFADGGAINSRGAGDAVWGWTGEEGKRHGGGGLPRHEKTGRHHLALPLSLPRAPPSSSVAATLRRPATTNGGGSLIIPREAGAGEGGEGRAERGPFLSLGGAEATDAPKLHPLALTKTFPKNRRQRLRQLIRSINKSSSFSHCGFELIALLRPECSKKSSFTDDHPSGCLCQDAPPALPPSPSPTVGLLRPSPSPLPFFPPPVVDVKSLYSTNFLATISLFLSRRAIPS